jgi:hypothetical protein
VGIAHTDRNGTTVTVGATLRYDSMGQCGCVIDYAPDGFLVTLKHQPGQAADYNVMYWASSDVVLESLPK